MMTGVSGLPQCGPFMIVGHKTVGRVALFPDEFGYGRFELATPVLVGR